jgi:hypothetical protein
LLGRRTTNVVAGIGCRARAPERGPPIDRIERSLGRTRIEQPLWERGIGP